MSDAAKIVRLEVGPWPMNAYVVQCTASGASAIVDPGAEPRRLLAAAGGSVTAILLTHGHGDHVGALSEVKQATDAPVYLHPADASQFAITADRALRHGDEISIGDLTLRAIHTPGHTSGMISLMVDHRVLSGDTIFVGGPGRTWSASCFRTTMRTMRDIVFRWDDETVFLPGHGPEGTIGQERPAYERFVASGWPDDLHGDVTWTDPPPGTP